MLNRRKAPRFLSLDETRRIPDELVGFARNLSYFTILTGMRSSEILALLWKDVNLKLGTILIRAETSRPRRMRVFPIYSELRSSFSEYPGIANSWSTEMEIRLQSKARGLPFGMP